MIIDQTTWYWYAAAILVVLFLTAKLVLAYAKYSQELESTRWQKQREQELQDEHLSRLAGRESELQRQFEERRKKVEADIEMRFETQLNWWKSQWTEEIKKAAKAEARVELDKWKVESEKGIRQSTLTSSKATVTGQILESLAPYLEGFDYNPKDAKFLGDPIDFVVFDGAYEGDLRRIVFLEVKTGDSQLSKKQKAIQCAIREGRVEWAPVLRISAVPTAKVGIDALDSSTLNSEVGMLPAELAEYEESLDELAAELDGPGSSPLKPKRLFTPPEPKPSNEACEERKEKVREKHKEVVKKPLFSLAHLFKNDEVDRSREPQTEAGLQASSEKLDNAICETLDIELRALEMPLEIPPTVQEGIQARLRDEGDDDT